MFDQTEMYRSGCKAASNSGLLNASSIEDELKTAMFDTNKMKIGTESQNQHKMKLKKVDE